MSRNSKRRRSARYKNDMSRASFDQEIDNLIVKISNEIDDQINRYKKVGKTFDLLYVVKLVAAKHVTQAKIDTIQDVYASGEDMMELSRSFEKSNRIVTVINNMIKVETY